MKIYEYIKKDNKRITKILGLKVLEQISNNTGTEKVQKFLNGILTVTKGNDLYSYKLFGKTIYENSILNIFKKEYFKYLSDEYDDIYILNANSGETYLILTYILNILIKRNQSKKPLLLATRKYHIDLIRMLCPDIPFIYTKKLNLKISEDKFKIDNFNFYLLLPSSYFRETEINIQKHQREHYFKSILKRLQLSEADIAMRKVIIPSDIETSMTAKISQTNLNINKFVFLAPEALSCKLYNDDFWCTLINTLQAKGYDVFVNLTKDDIKLTNAQDYKTCSLTFSEAFALAKHAKRIVSLRSGFTEFLIQTQTPMDVIYTPFKQRNSFERVDINHVISGFGLYQLPYINKNIIREINTNEITCSECVKLIVDAIIEKTNS